MSTTYNFKKTKSILYGILILLLMAGCGKVSDLNEDNTKEIIVETSPDSLIERSETESSEKNGYDSETIIETVKRYVDQSNFHAKEKIDYTQYKISTIEELKENDKAIEHDIKLLDTTFTIPKKDLFVVVGDTAEHDFVALVVDCTSLEVKGYVPSK